MEVLTSLAVMLGGIFLLKVGVDAAVSTPRGGRGNETTRICVPETLLKTCQQMSTDAASHSLLVTCVPARDRFNCLEKISDGSADFMQLDPEDIHLAMSFKDGLKIIKDIRTNDKAGERFRSRNVAVVHKNLRLNAISELRGRKSCHTGIGRNAGLVIAKLARLGALADIHSGERSSRENELRALSRFFSDACLVGVRSADPEENDRLKRAYANLCALCADPGRCDYPDADADADGALRCLTDKGGDVAWTKVHEVGKHFGIGGVRAEGRGKAADFRFLCRNATTVPLDGVDDCRWGARPWEAFVTAAPISAVGRVRRVVGGLDELGRTLDAGWRRAVLGIDAGSAAVDNEAPVSPKEYLDIADYTEVAARDFGPAAPLRLCVTSPSEAAKCAALAASAFSRALRPRIGCVVRTPSSAACMDAVRQGHADVVVVEPAELATAVSSYRLRPILQEQYGEGDVTAQYAVAVVKRLSPLRALQDLRGARSCHSSLNSPTGWSLPASVLLKQGLVDRAVCPPAKAVADFFAGGSCVPGADLEPLCALCVGNQNVTNRIAQRRSRCVADRNEEFFGEQGALLCMTSGAGDVAFLRHDTLRRNTDGNNLEHWAARLKAENYELICANGTRAAVDQYKTCNLGQVPARVLAASERRSEGDLRVLRDLLINAAAQYARRPDLFRMFGAFNGARDVIFSDSARGLVAVREMSAAHREFAGALKDVQTCAGAQKPPAWNWNKDAASR